MELTTKFDYGDLPEAEQRHGEKQADRLESIRHGVVTSVIEAGEILADMRVRLARGRTGTFESWVEKRCGFTVQHARRLMTASAAFGRYPNNVVRLFDDSALYVLAPDSAVQAREEALKLAGKGTLVTHAVAKQIVEKHRPSESGGYAAHGTGTKSRTRKGKTERSEPETPRTENAAPAKVVTASTPSPVVKQRELLGNSEELDGSNDPETPDSSPTSETYESASPAVTSEADPLDVFRDAVNRAMGLAKALPDNIRRACIKRLDECLEMALTGEALESPETVAATEIIAVPSVGEPAQDDAVMVFPTVPGKRGGVTTWSLTEALADEFREAFPGVDVLKTCREARLWCVANPTRRKTAKGMTEFLRRWLEKEQNRGGPDRAGGRRKETASDIADWVNRRKGGAA